MVTAEGSGDTYCVTHTRIRKMTSRKPKTALRIFPRRKQWSFCCWTNCKFMTNGRWGTCSTAVAPRKAKLFKNRATDLFHLFTSTIIKRLGYEYYDINKLLVQKRLKWAAPNRNGENKDIFALFKTRMIPFPMQTTENSISDGPRYPNSIVFPKNHDVRPFHSLIIGFLLSARCGFAFTACV